MSEKTSTEPITLGLTWNQIKGLRPSYFMLRNKGISVQEAFEINERLRVIENADERCKLEMEILDSYQ